MLAGYQTRKQYDISLEYMAKVKGEVRPVGMDLTTDAASAAFLNAIHAQTHDANDGLNNSGMLGGAYHPGRTVVSVALAAVVKELEDPYKGVLT
jgi:2-methylcitrate dehydratase PrpD